MIGCIMYTMTFCVGNPKCELCCGYVYKVISICFCVAFTFVNLLTLGKVGYLL